MKVLKFGGTSMATADTLRCVEAIVTRDDCAGYIVVSAPGKRYEGDPKVTDLLLEAHAMREDRCACDALLEKVHARFCAILCGLSLDFDPSGEFDAIRTALYCGGSRAYIASRGEYVAARIAAKYLGATFVDAAEIIRFDEAGNFDGEKTNCLCRARLGGVSGRVVIPGFYGATENGEIVTFARGGSDITGAIIARGVSAEWYENWTDVDGFLAADPHLCENPRVIDLLTHRELRELSYMGACVLHPDSVFPVRKANIPICIRNTFNPAARGTVIVPTEQFLCGKYTRQDRTVTGIAGKPDCAAIRIENSRRADPSFVRQLLQILERHEVLLEHLPSDTDAVTAVINTPKSEEVVEAVLCEIQAELKPRRLEYVRDLALIAVVGHGMRGKAGTAARILWALGEKSINVRMIDLGASDLRITVGVEKCDYIRATQALYSALA